MPTDTILTILPDDIPTICVRATAFPNGVEAAHQILHAKLPGREGRQAFGISYSGPTGEIVYFAAVTELHDGEAKQLGCEHFLIRKGRYREQVVPHFANNLSAVNQAFGQLLQSPDLDPEGYCLEVYDALPHLRCLVLLR